jgi:succinate dehydrogenase hydrophobic anchor subunit
MKILRGTVFGGVTYFLLGWLAWGILLMDFMSANMNQCAARSGVMKWWAMIVSGLAAALLLTLILNWVKAKGIINGLKYGALFGVLYGSVVDLSSWSMTTMFNNFGVLIVDVLVSTVVFGIAGLVIVLTWGKDK